MRLRVHVAIERTLRHLQDCQHRDDFSIRGAWSFAVWLGDLQRPTQGLDLAHRKGSGDPVALLREACSGKGRDSPIWGEQDVSEFGAAWTRRSRVRLRFRVHGAVIPLVIDIAHHVGSPSYIERLGIIPASGRRLLVNCLSREWMFAEKCALLVTYGPDHTRLQDLFDLHEMSRRFQFDGTALCDAFRTVASGRDAERMVRRHDGYWESSLATQRCSSRSLRRWEEMTGDGPPEQVFPCLQRAIVEVRRFVWPVLNAVRDGRAHAAIWRPQHGWTSNERERSISLQAALPFGTVRSGHIGAVGGHSRRRGGTRPTGWGEEVNL